MMTALMTPLHNLMQVMTMDGKPPIFSIPVNSDFIDDDNEYVFHSNMHFDVVVGESEGDTTDLARLYKVINRQHDVVEMETSSIITALEHAEYCSDWLSKFVELMAAKTEEIDLTALEEFSVEGETPQ